MTDLITNPQHPEVFDLYKKLKHNLISDNFSLLNQGLIHEKYQLLNNEFITNIRKFDEINEIINVINYPVFTYSIICNDIDVNILDLSQIVIAFLSLWYNMEIEYVNHIKLNGSIVFTPINHQGKHIYYKGLISEELIYEEIKGFKLLSDDPLTPYVVQEMYPNDPSSIYKSYKRLFLIKTEDYQKVEYIRNKIKEMKEEGYITFPNKFIILTKEEINIAAEMIKYSMINTQLLNNNKSKELITSRNEQKAIYDQRNGQVNYMISNNDIEIDVINNKFDNQIIRLEPFLIAKTSNPPSLESISSIKNNQLPIYHFNAPSSWLVHISSQTGDDPIKKLQLKYLSIISYLETAKRYPILKYTIKSLKTLSSSRLSAQFPHDYAYLYFNRLLKDNIERTVLNQKNNLLHRVFNDYSEAIIFRWKFQNIIKSLILRHNTSYYVFFEIDNAVELPDYQPDDVRQEIINQINSEDVIFFLSLVPMSENKYIEDTRYKKLILDGYFGTPLLKGILSFDLVLKLNIEIGTILMNKNLVKPDLIQYSFEISLTNNDLYLPLNNAVLSKFDKKDIKRNNIERKFYDTYNLETAEISLIYPSKDPGYIYPLFDIILPINKYEDNEIYEKVENFWRNGHFLSTWGKSIYLDHNKISVAFLNLPNIYNIFNQ